MFAVALLSDSLARTRLTRALALLRWRCHFVANWSEVAPAVRHWHAELFAFDPYLSGHYPDGDLLECIAVLPPISLFAYGRFPPNSAPDVLHMAWIGVHGAAVRDLGDAPSTLERSIEAAVQRSFVGRAREVIETHVAPPAHEILLRVLSHAGSELTPADAARLCHCHPKTLATRLKAAGLPSPARVIVWMRLARAASLLAGGQRTVEAVALELGFPSANSFRNQLARYTGTNPTKIRAQRDPLLVVRRFAQHYQQRP